LCLVKQHCCLLVWAGPDFLLRHLLSKYEVSTTVYATGMESGYFLVGGSSSFASAAGCFSFFEKWIGIDAPGMLLFGTGLGPFRGQTTLQILLSHCYELGSSILTSQALYLERAAPSCTRPQPRTSTRLQKKPQLLCCREQDVPRGEGGRLVVGVHHRRAAAAAGTRTGLLRKCHLAMAPGRYTLTTSQRRTHEIQLKYGDVFALLSQLHDYLRWRDSVRVRVPPRTS
jgi:hypothetical protein